MADYLTANEPDGALPRSWYAETAGPEPEFPALSEDVRADVCVIGGGYAGLSAALHLAERGVDVVLIEANSVGWGASGRNGGQIGVGPRASITDYEKRVGRDDARKVWDLALGANALVRDLIERHEIDCDLTDGFVECAWRARDVPELHEFVEHVRVHYGHGTISPVGSEEMAALLGTVRYFGGYRDQSGAHLHPLKFARGLARAASQAGARVCQRTRATDVSPGQVRTPVGTVRADEILLCCNGYIDGLAPAAKARMLPLNNFVLATEPLGDDRARRVNRDNLCASDTRFVLNYFRLSPDGRMLWGGGESTSVRFPTNLDTFVRRRMLEIYPDLADVKITHAWGGTLAITGTRYPLFHDMDTGVRAIGGWSGSGIHMATMGGKVAADAITADVGDWSLLARMPTPAFPGGDWFRSPLLRAAMFWYGLRDRL